jgi:large subunit ribosomal protein L25
MSTATGEVASALRAIKRFRLYALNTKAKYKRVAPEPTSQATTDASPAAGPNTPTPIQIFNPFLPWKNPRTGRWAPPQFSLRRQAELVKKAKLLGPEALALLPPGLKMKVSPPSVLEAVKEGSSEKRSDTHDAHADAGPSTNVTTESVAPRWQLPITWTGTVPQRTVRGKEVGYLSRLYAGRQRMFKGHKWERTSAERMKKRAELMRKMNKTVRKYKSVCIFVPAYALARANFLSCPLAVHTPNQAQSITASWRQTAETTLLIALPSHKHLSTFGHQGLKSQH